MERTSGNLSGSQPLMERAGKWGLELLFAHWLGTFRHLKANTFLRGGIFLCIGPLRKKRGARISFFWVYKVDKFKESNADGGVPCGSSGAPVGSNGTVGALPWRPQAFLVNKGVQCCSLSQRSFFFPSPSWPCGGGSTFTTRQWWRPGLCLAAVAQSGRSMRH